MLISRSGFLHCRYHPFDDNSLSKLLACGFLSTPRSISDDRHDDESSKLELRLCRLKHAQFLNIMSNVYNSLIIVTNLQFHLCNWIEITLSNWKHFMMLQCGCLVCMIYVHCGTAKFLIERVFNDESHGNEIRSSIFNLHDKCLPNNL